MCFFSFNSLIFQHAYWYIVFKPPPATFRGQYLSHIIYGSSAEHSFFIFDFWLFFIFLRHWPCFEIESVISNFVFRDEVGPFSLIPYAALAFQSPFWFVFCFCVYVKFASWSLSNAPFVAAALFRGTHIEELR